MRIRSIRWSLFLWYALILIGAVAALGWTLHDELEQTLYGNADDQINFWMTAAEHELIEYSIDKAVTHIQEALPSNAIFAIWDETGKSIAASDQAQTLSRPARAGPLHWDHIRANTLYGPKGHCLMIGKSVEAEHDDIRQFLMVLLIASSVILVIALGGGWFLVARSLQPIQHISNAAQRITADNLSERIDTNEIENELSALATTLNGTFDRLEQAIERQARFTADASHELRTPLSIVLAHLELATTSDKTKEELSDRVAICQEASMRMKSIVEGLLTLARADAGETNLELSEFDFADLLENVRTSMNHFATERDITITHDVEPLILRGDKARLHELATNLYLNAIHYNETGGKIEVSLKREGEEAVLCVKDTGIGISPDDQKKIFERFFRVDASRSRERGGSGLGLAIVYWITELHGGTIAVTSTPGTGTSFTLRLPIGQ